MGKGHPTLADLVGRGPRDTEIVGGIFSRDASGRSVTNEKSGHYFQNWSDPIRAQFSEFMSSKGVSVNHNPGM